MSSFKIRFLVLGALMLILAPGTAKAGTITFQEDVSPDAGYQHLGAEAREGTSGNYHDGTEIRVGCCPNTMRTLLAFDLQNPWPGNAIDEVTLSMTINSTSGSASGLGVINLHAILPGDMGEHMVERCLSWVMF